MTAHAADGSLVGVLSLVPWGRSGVSLDVMRRSPDAPNGVTELMVSELLAHARRLGLARVSLNFCMFRAVFEDAERLGSRSLTRVGASVLGFFDRVWQLERLYRANEKYEPAWQPRFLCYDDAVSLPQVALAAGAAEGFVRHPSIRSVRTGRPSSTPSTSPRWPRSARRPSTSRRSARAGPTSSATAPPTLDRMRAAGVDAYPVGAASVHDDPDRRPSARTPGRPRERCPSWDGCGRCATTAASSSRPSSTARHGCRCCFDAARLGRECLDQFTAFVDVGDLVRVDGTTGRSRTGTPSLLADDWRMEAKSPAPRPVPRLRRPGGPGAAALDRPARPPARRRAAAAPVGRRRVDPAGRSATPASSRWRPRCCTRPTAARARAPSGRSSTRTASTCRCASRPSCTSNGSSSPGSVPIFELGRNFRNEGADATHNPEFTSLEVYQPHADYTTMRHLTERLVRAAARTVHGREVIPLPVPGPRRDGLDALDGDGTQGVDLVDISGEWPVVKVLDAVSDAVGQRVTVDTDIDVLLGLAEVHGITVRPEMGAGAVIEELYAELVEPVTMLPTFYTDFPVETSPLTRPHRTEPGSSSAGTSSSPGWRSARHTAS